MKHPIIITLLTDFGLADHYVAAMKGVILGICPQAQLVDISHEVTPYSISEAAFTLAQAWRCFPKGTVHLIVIDPGVGSSRRPILAEAGGHYFVAPDNGVLTMVLDSEPKHRVREITAAAWFRNPASATFHGRDIFAPVAGYVVAGIAVSRFGKRIRDYVRLGISRPVRTKKNSWAGIVLKVDRFGNIITNFDRETFRGLAGVPFRISLGSAKISRLLSSYSEAADHELFAIWGSAGYLEISSRERSAAARLRIGPESPVLLAAGLEMARVPS